MARLVISDDLPTLFCGKPTPGPMRKEAEEWRSHSSVASRAYAAQAAQRLVWGAARDGGAPIELGFELRQLCAVFSSVPS
jgi:predicted lipoprotein